MTIWGDDKDKDSSMYNNVQVEIGVDETDIWLAFNKATAAVQFTHAEAWRLIGEMQEALRKVESEALNKRFIDKISEQGHTPDYEGEEEEGSARKGSTSLDR